MTDTITPSLATLPKEVRARWARDAIQQRDPKVTPPTAEVYEEGTARLFTGGVFSNGSPNTVVFDAEEWAVICELVLAQYGLRAL